MLLPKELKLIKILNERSPDIPYKDFDALTFFNQTLTFFNQKITKFYIGRHVILEKNKEQKMGRGRPGGNPRNKKVWIQAKI